jgi:hypothetical protein
MGLNYLIVTRLPLPEPPSDWSFEIDNLECEDDSLDYENYDYDGSMVIYLTKERDYIDYVIADLPNRSTDSLDNFDKSRLVFTPGDVLIIAKVGWEMSQLVAETIAEAFGGIVMTEDPDDEILYESAATVNPPKSMNELEDLIMASFRNPEPIFERWSKDLRHTKNMAPEKYLEANDWSDV